MLCSWPAAALDFRAVADPVAILYDAPSAKSGKLYVVNKGYPLEVVVTVEGWVKVRDANGFPVPRVTYAPGKHEIAAQRFYIPHLTELVKATGADAAAAIPDTSSPTFPVARGDVPDGAHIMGGMPMGKSPKRFVCDDHGRVHTLDNVFVCDGSVFVTSGAMNPTLTIMATALRNARRFA